MVLGLTGRRSLFGWMELVISRAPGKHRKHVVVSCWWAVIVLDTFAGT